MGLIKEGDDFAVLSDILGDEDHLGDMDFKVAGTREGITALQMDIKIAGITEEIMKKALAQASEGRLHILINEVVPGIFGYLVGIIIIAFFYLGFAAAVAYPLKYENENFSLSKNG